MKKILLSSTILLALLTFNSCEKKETDTETDSAVDNTIAEAEFTAILPSTSSKAVAQSGGGQLKLVSAYVGPLITVDKVNYLDNNFDPTGKWPRLMTICYDTLFEEASGKKTYKPDGIQGDDQKTRKGTLRCLVYKPWNGDDAFMKIYKNVVSNNPTTIPDLKGMDNYTVNGIKYEADEIKIEKETYYVNNIKVDKKRLKVVGGKCSTALWNIQWSTERTVNTENAGQPDEVITVSGTASGVSRLGLGYTTTITSPLVKYTDCAYIGKGTIEITPSGKEPRIIDYGDGTCDNKATLTIKGVKFSFNL